MIEITDAELERFYAEHEEELFASEAKISSADDLELYICSLLDCNFEWDFGFPLFSIPEGLKG